MSVIFESVIKCNDLGFAYIELKDTVTQRIEICNDLEDFSKKIEELGSDYGGRIDEVKWSADDNVPQSEIDKIKLAMLKYQEEIEKK
ncbi:hypothetical protein [Poseidonibacter ostreae]|jgi:hypothetical protein|uniref:Uncharacterized protein n=1 Tax=Poseidonibacter ostreae TaxID=2654171 RepID=A0A6L4WSU0_9BACT|nr:hypothetical protein [Poseidonibacter ostreae]KAB7885466.1 hypothetical protein GA417_08520 [Poseidonibacter ostreae]KAB7887817.1 hypothetical protein GBG19_10025 [Poseidonibacter ostreae]KAB7890515.1 hypothetical protein GBG18_08720 [Poseidonibacter ostreae]MAC83010.1 hypothetical protein [Arcobacter sp.]|tara:strand:+ start:1316 stop:1576 length:261 start_codon:yes stop_codon:yes gene_type:complete